MSPANAGYFQAWFFSFYKVNPEKDYSKFVYSHKGEDETLDCFESMPPEEKGSQNLAVLHPLAKKFLLSESQESAKSFQLSSPLKDELRRSVWLAAAPKWIDPNLRANLHHIEGGYYFAFRILDIRLMQFPSGIAALYFNVEPAFDHASEETPIAKMILNSLYRIVEHQGAHKNTLIRRLFSDPRQRTAAQKWLQNNDLPLCKAFAGEEIALGDVIAGLLSKNAVSLMANRYLTFSLLQTAWDGRGEPFNEVDKMDLIRLSRAESDHYLPDKREYDFQQGHILATFENVVFALAAEGVVCWIKPKPDQEFLSNQFKDRFNTIYLNLFLLALHQRYGLIALNGQLDRYAPLLEEFETAKGRRRGEKLAALDEKAQQLRLLRAQIANFYLKAFFQQPAALTNHQQFYTLLQKHLGVADLLDEVQQSTRELDYILRDFQQLTLLQDMRNLNREQERSSRNELVLTLVVEGLAIPYYLHSFLIHAFEFSNPAARLIALIVTAIVMIYTVLKFRQRPID